VLFWLLIVPGDNEQTSVDPTNRCIADTTHSDRSVYVVLFNNC